ncbi:hypothetical protein GCM10027190_15020 [Spirosoma areae]
MPLWFSSCQKSSDDAVTPTSASIVGTWKMTTYTVNPGYDIFGFGQPITDLLGFLRSLPTNAGADAVSCLTETKLIFSADGKATSIPGAKCDAAINSQAPIDGSATWKLAGDKLTTVSSTGTDVYTVVITGNVLKLIQQRQEDTNGDGKPETYTLTIELLKT